MWTLTLFTMEFDIELLYIQIERSEQIIPFKSIRLYIPPDMLPSTVVDAIFFASRKVLLPLFTSCRQFCSIDY